MAISMGGDSGGETPMSDINTTPLVDVMLVLLIIFLIAVPVVVQTDCRTAHPRAGDRSSPTRPGGPSRLLTVSTSRCCWPHRG